MSRHSELKTSNAAMNDDDVIVNDRDPVGCNNHMMTWFGWMTLFGVIGVLAAIGVQCFVNDWCDGELARQSHEWMNEQAEQLRRGEINCLVNPDPAFVDELLADTSCAAKVRDLYVGSDLSDQRLGRLRELPNLKCIVFLFPENQNALLSRLRGMSSIEELTFDRTRLSREDLAIVGAFPKLKSLSFDQYDLRPADMQGLAGHPTLERLFVKRAAANNELIGLFRSMPCLRELSLGVCGEDYDASQNSFEKALKKALPRCKCRVWDDRR